MGGNGVYNCCDANHPYCQLAREKEVRRWLKMREIIIRFDNTILWILAYAIWDCYFRSGYYLDGAVSIFLQKLKKDKGRGHGRSFKRKD